MLSSSVGLFPFLLLATASAVSTSNYCHEIPKDMPFSRWKNCIYSNGRGIGNNDEFVVLDFSEASEQEITNFFAKPTEENVTLSAGIRLVDNNNVETLNFGKVTIININGKLVNHLAEVPVVFIQSNYVLSRIMVNLFVAIAGDNANAKFWIVNNPSLKVNGSLSDAISRANINISLVTEHRECTFNLLNRSAPGVAPVLPVPSDDKLELCKVITGDFYPKDRKLPSSIEVAGGCLRLINVDFGDYSIGLGKTRQLPNGQLQCQNGEYSALINNRNLCGFAVSELARYIQGGPKAFWNGTSRVANFTVILNEETCSRDCTASEADDPHYLCRTFKENVDITKWFEQKEYAQKIDFLQSSRYTTNITGTKQTALRLPNLKHAYELRIVNNYILESVVLPALTVVDILYIYNNLYWPLAEMTRNLKNVSIIDGARSVIECNFRGLHNIPVDDFRRIELCTKIDGSFILENVSDKDTDLFKVSHIEGCFTVRNTTLTSLWFMENMEISCYYGPNLIENNPNLCPRGHLKKKKDMGKVVESNNAKDGCPCILEDLAKNAINRPVNCSVTNVFKAFDCNLYDGSQLVEVNGTLILENCLNLDVDFPVLKKITGSRQGAALIVAASSSLPSLEFLKRIEITFMQKKIVVPYKPASKALMEIRSKMTIHQYLTLKYTYDEKILVHLTPVADTCYNWIGVFGGCKIFEGDLVVNADILNNPGIETITGCLIVQNGTQLFFLDRIKHIGNTCLYQDEKKYPLSPSRGFKKTTISQMKKKYCPSREERERLAPITNLTTIELSGEAPECSKSCNKMSAGNCDTFYGNLVLSPNDYVKNLEVIYGSLVIEGMLPETIEFPKLTRIAALTAPALVVQSNVGVRFLHMPKLVNISADNNKKPLIMVTGNRKLQELGDFIPSALLPSCENVRNALCYADILGQDEVVEKKDRNWEDAKILAVVLALMFGVPVAYHFLTFEEREAALEERKRRQEETRRRRKTDRRRRDRGEARSPRTAKAPTPAQTSRIAKSLMTTAPGGSSSWGTRAPPALMKKKSRRRRRSDRQEPKK